MANAVAKKSAVCEVTLTLTREEALALWHLTRRVSESPNKNWGEKTVKIYTDAVRNALKDAFDGDVAWSDFDPTAVFGGNMPARTDSLDHLDPRSAR